MPEHQIEQWLNILHSEDYLAIWIERFLVDRKVEGYTPGTLYFYRAKLALLTRFCEGQAITRIGQIDAEAIRRYLLWLEQMGHNPGGRHAAYRAAKTLIRWWAREIEPRDWSDPFRRVKPPKLAQEPLEPVTIETVKMLVATCAPGEFIGARDRSIFLFLIDTGLRAAELLSLARADVDLVNGSMLIRQGKGRKPRTVFFGKVTRRALRAYLKMRLDKTPALWITEDGEQLTYWGLRSMVARRARQSGVKPPKLHDFRRAFALGMLRAGVDVYTLQNLMGHTDLQVLRRYLAQSNQDLAEAHRKAGPVDRAGLDTQYGSGGWRVNGYHLPDMADRGLT